VSGLPRSAYQPPPCQFQMISRHVRFFAASRRSRVLSTAFQAPLSAFTSRRSYIGAPNVSPPPDPFSPAQPPCHTHRGGRVRTTAVAGSRIEVRKLASSLGYGHACGLQGGYRHTRTTREIKCGQLPPRLFKHISAMPRGRSETLIAYVGQSAEGPHWLYVTASK
jgi:hypothetical protein